MLREVLRSTLYSSSRPFSSNATRRSSFSALITILFPVLRGEKPKIFRTLSNIQFNKWVDLHRMNERDAVHRWKSNNQNRRRPGGGGVGVGRGCEPKSRSKNPCLCGGGVGATGTALGGR